MTNASAKLVMGPIPYLWSGEVWRDFYFRLADEAPIDVVSIGEVVCSKRLHFYEPFIDAVVERLERAGKQVHMASLAMVTLERERKAQIKLFELTHLPIEAGDLSALLKLAGRPHTIGPLLNTYSAATARVYAARGATSICLPPELPMNSILEIAQGHPGAEIEVFAFGRTPLAISARCAHARAKGHTKDNCHFVCGEEPDGLAIDTLEGQHFLTLNGVQTMSHSCHLVLAELDKLAKAGVSRFRLSPQDCDMVAVARLFRAILDGRTEATQAHTALEAIYPGVPFSNGFLYGAEGARWIDDAA